MFSCSKRNTKQWNHLNVQCHLERILGGLGNVEDSRNIIQCRLEDIADHGHLGLRGHRGHGSAVAAADTADTDDTNLMKEQQHILRSGAGHGGKSLGIIKTTVHERQMETCRDKYG